MREPYRGIMRVAGRYVKQAVREGTGEVAVGVVSELAADARATVALTGVYHNLLRRWVEA